MVDENEEPVNIEEKTQIFDLSKAKPCDENCENNEDGMNQISKGSTSKVEKNKEKLSAPRNSSFGNLHAQMRFLSIDLKTQNDDEDDLEEFIKELKTYDKAMKMKKLSESGENEENLFKMEKLPRRASAFGDYCTKNDTKKHTDNNDDDVFAESESSKKINKFMTKNNNRWLASSFNSFLVLDSKIKVSEKPVRCIRLIE